MPRFFIDYAPQQTAEITGGDARHIALSLRMKTGEELTLTHSGIDYLCTIESINPESVILSVKNSEPCAAEPSVELTLFQAMPKLDKLETIVQKAVELGACRIVPVMTRRCISRPKDAEFEKKRVRLAKIALEAAKQSGRGIVPEIAPMMSLKNAIEEMKKSDIALMCYENGGKHFSEIGLPKSGSISLLIGSEGGFDFQEADNAIQNGVVPIWLGSRILRCETAPIAAISVIMHMTENF